MPSNSSATFSPGVRRKTCDHCSGTWDSNGNSQVSRCPPSVGFDRPYGSGIEDDEEDADGDGAGN